MSEFMKTVSSLKQNFFACLPAIAALCAALPPGGWGGSQTQAFSSVKMLIFVAGELWPGIDLQDESPNTSRPDTRKVGE